MAFALAHRPAGQHSSAMRRSDRYPIPASLLRRVAVVALVLLATGCSSRPLTEAERAFASSVLGPAVDAGEVRVVRGSVAGVMRPTIPPRPRTTCQERLQPPRDEAVKGRFAAMTLGRSLYYSRDAWDEDFLAGYPADMELTTAMVFAHEMVHVWQWQQRDRTGYHPLKAGTEHVEADDPYLLEIDPEKLFLDYSYEQQGALVEELVCCRALDPGGARTAALLDVVREVFPAAAASEPVPRSGVTLPWPGAETEGICG